MTLTRAAGAIVLVATVVQCALIWQGTFAVMAIGLLLVGSREASGR